VKGGEPVRIKYRDPHALSTLIASAIGLLALVVSAYTAYVQRQQVRAMVWPRVQLWTAMLSHKYTAVNHGMGPARVTGVRLHVDGKLVRSWREAVKVTGATGNEPFLFSSLNERVMPPGENVQLFHASEDDQSRQLFTNMFRSHTISMLICYCSVLDDCWLAGFGLQEKVNTTHPIETCPIAEDEQFRN
jgi:hypothetical protein